MNRKNHTSGASPGGVVVAANKQLSLLKMFAIAGFGVAAWLPFAALLYASL